MQTSWKQGRSDACHGWRDSTASAEVEGLVSACKQRSV
jgi:hypothetical protein